MEVKEAILTGYYPANNSMEGGFEDCLGNPLRTLSDYDRNNKDHSYVSLATDPTFIPTKSHVNIEGFNDKDGVPVLFYACDVGSLIKGEHVDICCGSKEQTFKIDSDGKKRKLTILK